MIEFQKKQYVFLEPNQPKQNNTPSPKLVKM